MGIQIQQILPEAPWGNFDALYFPKGDQPEKNSAIKALASFANTRGGIVFFGVNPNGEADGLEIDEIAEIKSVLTASWEHDIFPNVPLRFFMRSLDDMAEKYVLGAAVDKSSELFYYQGKALRFEQGQELPFADEKENWNDLASPSKAPFRASAYSNLASFLSPLPLNQTLLDNGILLTPTSCRTALALFKDLYNGKNTSVVIRVFDSEGQIPLAQKTVLGPLQDVFSETIDFLFISPSSFLSKAFSDDLNAKRELQQALALCFLKRDYESDSPIEVSLAPTRIQFACPGRLQKKSGEEHLLRLLSLCSFCEEYDPLLNCLSLNPDSPFHGKAIRLKEGGFKLSLSLGEEESYARPLFRRKKKADAAMREKILEALSQGDMGVADLQKVTPFSSRAYFLKALINPMMEEGLIEKVGDKHSPVCVFHRKNQ